MAELAGIVTVAKEGVEAASGMLDLYNETISTIIPWDTFDETVKALKDNEEQYSEKAAVLVGKIQALLLDSCDAYKSSQEEVSRWCKVAAPVLGEYMKLFELTADKNIAEAQRLLLLKVLNDGSDHLSRAIEKLETSRLSFNTAYGELTALRSQLDSDFTEGSSFYETADSKLRTEAYAGAAAGAVFGPIGLAISYGIAAGVVEGELIPKLKKAFEETKKQFDKLKVDIKEAQNSIELAKIAITEEIRVVGTMSAKIEELEIFADIWVKVPSVLFNGLKTSTLELIDMCNQYIRAAEGKAVGG